MSPTGDKGQVSHILETEAQNIGQGDNIRKEGFINNMARVILISFNNEVHNLERRIPTSGCYPHVAHEQVESPRGINKASVL